MFPSSGLFAHIDCSLFEGALCERPHCVFKHSLILFVVAASEEAADECLQELERINREIESVKHQVEEEQRKLSHYQINQASERSNSYNPQVMSKNVAQSCYSSHTSPSAPHSKPKKYILDSSKPRTDLEYDPLSNFSSDLRSYCSSNREQKTRREQVTLNQRKRNVYIPLGATVIDVGNNLHLVLPEGTFPVSNSSGQVTSVLTPITTVNTDQVTSVLTPITPVNTHSVTIRQACHPSAPTQQRRTSQPVIIPPLARRPVMATTIATKRKLKQQCETVKVPHDIRQSYVNKFTEEFFKTTGNVHEAFEKALAEEKAVYNRSMNKLKYLSIAVNALKKLRNQSCGAAEGEGIYCNSFIFALTGMIMLYECLKDYVLTEEMLIEKNFPLQNPEKNGSAILFSDNKKSILDRK
uniref:RNA exonuclease 1 homolog-like domain-containing protein n=1 Tax=Periophthalmus magnuspinnatus TaxID=409849 RepID=A0A3B3ZTJ9_9GOBI